MFLALVGVVTYNIRNAEASAKVFPLSRHFWKGLALYPATYGNTSGYFVCSHARCLLCLFVAGQVVDYNFFLLFPCWKPAAEAGNDTNENCEGGGWWGWNSEVGEQREKAPKSREELHSWIKTLGWLMNMTGRLQNILRC